MSAVVKKVTGGGDSKPAATKAVETVAEKKTATRAQTESAMERQAFFRARRGRGGLFARNLGDTQDTLGG